MHLNALSRKFRRWPTGNTVSPPASVLAKLPRRAVT